MRNDNFILKFNTIFPMIKILHMEDNLYAYDAKSNFLSEISEEELNLLYCFYYNTDLILPEYLHSLIAKNVFSSGGVLKLTPSVEETAELVEFELNNQLPRKFTLEVTEECTLRCKYCFYTTEDKNKRRHSFAKMQENTAYKAIDLYFSRYTSLINQISEKKIGEVSKSLFPNLCWWGGEPFLNFSLMKKTKEYIESLDWESYGISKRDIFYNVVTNFTVFNEEILNFLVDNNIYVQISLDGDKEDNDKNRVFPNKKGSFDCVFNNINILIDRYPEYGKKYVSIQTVNADNTNEENILDFFKKNFKINAIDSKISIWNPSFERHEKEFISRKISIDDSELAIFRTLLSKLKGKERRDIQAKMMKNRSIYTLFQELYLLGENIQLSNPKGINKFSNKFSCPLGTDTLFVSANGNLHACCKVDQSLPIGDVESGLITEKIEAIYNSYFRKIETKCKECWAINFCKICPALVCYEGDFSLPIKEECSKIKKMAEITLKKYIILSMEFEALYADIVHIFKESKNYRFDSTPITIKHFEL